jgi:GntR family transcriptional regulator, transcriptional repressor for pyruvate dehydrogenase complex
MADKPRKNLSQQLAERIRQHVEQARLPDGALFMTEAEVAEKYQVSRTVAREAVGRLRAIGLLEGRQHKGLIVRHPDPLRLFSDSLPSLARSDQDMSELARLRYVLEVGAIELAVRCATHEQIARLTEIAEQIKKVVRTRAGSKRQKDLDIAFHSLLLEMTGSELVAGMQRVLVDFFRAVSQRTPLDAANAERAAWEHAELAAAVRDRDVERARAMIRAQLRRYLSESEGGLQPDRKATRTAGIQEPTFPLPEPAKQELA